MNGEKVGKAWQAAVDRLPHGWIINRLELHPKGMLQIGPEIVQRTELWIAHARPKTGGAWKGARQRGQEQGFNGRGQSPVEALLDLAVRAEMGAAVATTPAERRQDAVTDLFNALFPTA